MKRPVGYCCGSFNLNHTGSLCLSLLLTLISQPKDFSTCSNWLAHASSHLFHSLYIWTSCSFKVRCLCTHMRHLIPHVVHLWSLVLCWSRVLFSFSSSDKLKLLSQPDHTEILSYTLGLLSLVIASTSRFPAICRAVRDNHWKCFYLSKQQLSTLLIFCCSPSSVEATSGLGHMWSPGCLVQLLVPSMLLQCSSMTLGLGFWWESCRGWCRLSAAPSWIFLYPYMTHCHWLWSSTAVATSEEVLTSDDDIPVQHSVGLLFGRLSDSNHPLAQERNQASTCFFVLRHREPFGLFCRWG